MNVDEILYAPITRATEVIISGLSIPKIWLDVLAKIQTQWPMATIAGGALRDLDQGFPQRIKDVDIFMPFDPAAKKKMERLGFVVSVRDHDPGRMSALAIGAQAPTHLVFSLDGWEFEVTLKYEPFTHITLVDSFDLGICMISLVSAGADYQVYRSPDYITDATYHTITIINSNGRAASHASRILDKYPGWQVAISVVVFP